MSYDKSYSETNNVFGDEPEKTLTKFLTQIDKSSPVLDIGAGQGRNTFYLAQNGFEVDAIDPSKIAVETIYSVSQANKYHVNAYQQSFDSFITKNSYYSAILVFGLLQILNWKAIGLLIAKIGDWINKDGLVFITAFSTKDDSYEKYKSRDGWSEIGKNSFSDNNSYRTFLEPQEVLKLFKGYEVVHHWEGTGAKHRHGDSPLEQHEMIELVVRHK